jgi:hypothetical protein
VKKPQQAEKLQEEHQMKHRLFEGLRKGDLQGFVDTTFTIDQYTSKMGQDSDVLVLGFKVNDKHPAIDLMEFIEKGYPFVLDADMSSGEEKDGKYQVFVEIQRTKHLPGQIRDLLSGVGQLVDSVDWRYRYHKGGKSKAFSEQSILEDIPLSQEDYKNKMLEIKGNAIKEFFDKTPFDSVKIDENHSVTISKPFSGSVNLELLAMGPYQDIQDSLQGAIQLDEASQSQVNFLEKYLGPYEIHKINDKFLVRNGDTALVFKKERW